MATLKELRDSRIEKLNKIKELGIDPYPAKSFKDTENQSIQDNFEKYENKDVIVAGRAMAVREHGQLAFIDLNDQTGKIQLYIKKENLQDADYKQSELNFDDLKLLDFGDFIEGHGKVTKTKRGEISVEVSKVRLLTKSLRPMPSAWDGLTDIETRYRQRYVDMTVNPEVRKVFEQRTLIVSTIRNFLASKGFWEIETPILQPLYGGASARPFKTFHNSLGSDFYLRISNELYLKRAIAGGFEKVFEFARDFRNEGIDRSHNPEFTMLEFYWAYANYDDLMTLTEEMITEVLMKIHGSTKFMHNGIEIDFTVPYKRITFRDIILENTNVDIDTVTREEIIEEIKKRKLDIDLSKNPPLKDLLDEFYKETCRKYITQPIYLLDYPYEMIPLAKKKFENPSKIASFQLVSMGMELIKAYNELNDPIDQKERMQEEQKALDEGYSEEAHPIDYDFIRALEFGMPPTAGWGMGIDRFTSFILDKPTLKDVIMFPTLRPENMLLEESDIYPEIQKKTN